MKHDIPVVRDLPTVGATLRDHCAFPVQVSVPQREAIHQLDNPLILIREFLKWLILGIGLLAEMTTSRSIFLRTTSLDEGSMTVRHDRATDLEDERGIPDVEIMLFAMDNATLHYGGPPFLCMLTTLVQPFSVGRVSLARKDASDGPSIDYPMLTDERDYKTLRTALKFAMHYGDEFCKLEDLPFPAKLAYAPGMDLSVLDRHNAKRNTAPRQRPIAEMLSHPKKVAKKALDQMGPDSNSLPQPGSLDWKTVTNAEIDAYAQRVGMTSLHFGCTCRMALTPEDGVVDQELKVFGLRNLRIADASVFPSIPSAHTMHPTVVVAERCADFIVREWRQNKEK
jgi:choline dehydrogenase-like flavoprotein